jgi:hypothetical protein
LFVVLDENWFAVVALGAEAFPFNVVSVTTLSSDVNELLRHVTPALTTTRDADPPGETCTENSAFFSPTEIA